MAKTTITDFDAKLSPFIRNNPCPEPGGGVHQWLFDASLSLWGIGMTDEDEIARIVEDLASRKHSKEIADAVRNAGIRAGTESNFQGHSDRATPPGIRPKAKLNPEAIEAARNRFGGLARLKVFSPADVTQWTAENIIDGLFPGNPLLCVARSKYDAETLPREEFRGREMSFSFLVPSPMSSRHGTNQDGDTSSRCLDNTGPRRFLVIESDRGTMDEQAGVLLQLATTAPLVLVIHSGGKSLHAWFYCEGQEEEQLHAFHTKACELGADHSTWTRCQLVRMPGGRRENGAKQELLFLHPAACRGFPSVPTPEGYCPHCWSNNRAMLMHSRFPCNHQRRAE